MWNHHCSWILWVLHAHEFTWPMQERIVCLFVIWRRHRCRWRAANFEICSALMAIEQWGFFSVPHLLWHWASIYNGHLRGPVTHTYCRAFSSGAVTICFYDSGLSRLGFEHPTFRLRHRRGRTYSNGFYNIMQHTGNHTIFTALFIGNKI